jgi:hypothetical protein
MGKKLPNDAYAYYLSLGSTRTYRAVAEHFGVSVRAVSKRASTEEWQKRIKAADQEACEAVLEKTKAEAIERSLRWLRKLDAEHRRSMEAIIDMEIQSVDDALRVLEWSLKEEWRLVRLLTRQRQECQRQASRAAEGTSR